MYSKYTLYIVFKQKIKKQQLCYASFGRFISSWDRTHPSLPLPQSSLSKKGGRCHQYTPGLPVLVNDPGLTGVLTAGQPRPGKLLLL